MSYEISLAGKTVIVVGAGGGGIGSAVARLLAEADASVCAVDIKPAAADQILDELRTIGDGKHRACIADARDPADVNRVVELAARDNDLHGLVHVAGGIGAQMWSTILYTEPSTFEDIVRLNLVTAMITSRAVATRLSPGGSVVLVSSTTGISSLPYGAAYGAAKAAMHSYTKTAAIEWAPRRIRVNAVAPGPVALAGQPEPEGQAGTIPLGRLGDPADVAAAALFLLSELSSWITGQVLVVDGGTLATPHGLNPDNMPFAVAADPAQRVRLLDQAKA